MEIFLTKDLETWMRDCVRAGTYRSEGELVRHALRLLRAQEKPKQAVGGTAREPVRRNAREREP